MDELEARYLTKYVYPAIILMVVVFALALIYEEKNIEQEATDHLIEQLKNAEQIGKRYTEENLQSSSAFLNFLIDTPPIQRLNRARNQHNIDSLDNTSYEQWRHRLAQIFIAQLHSYPNINQLRLIDAKSGMELVKVARFGGQVLNIPEIKLQNKGTYNYVKKALQLPEHRIFVSPINLNKEYGKIVYPIQPTIRLSEPVYDDKNQLFAVLVINLNAQAFIDNMLSKTTGDVRTILLTADEHFIYHPQQNLRFSSELNPQQTWQTNYIVEPSTNPNFSRAIFNRTGAEIFFTKTNFQYSADQSAGNQLTLINYLPASKYYQEVSRKRYIRYGLLILLTLIFAIILLAILFYLRNAQKLANTRSEFAAIINGASDGIIGLNNKLQISSFNKAASEYIPLLNKNMINNSIALATEIPIQFIQDSLQKLKNNQATESLKLTLNSKVGHVDTVIFSSPIRSSKQELLGMALFIKDVTAQAKFEKEILEINESLESQINERTKELQIAHQKALQSSEIKSAFVSTISHEMRTPLNGILGALGLIKRGHLNSQQKNYLNMMETSSTTLGKLINDILDLSKIEAGKLELEHITFNPIDLLENVITSVALKAQEKGLECVLDLLDVQHIQLVGDPNRIKQLLFNLLSNAIKFTTQGSVYVAAYTTQQVEQITFTIVVQDTGKGIDKKNHHRLFQAFNQETSAIAGEYGGTGLGLSITKQLCQLLGGDISFVSALNKGSTFTLSLPFLTAESKFFIKPQILTNYHFNIKAFSGIAQVKWRKLISYFGGVVTDYAADFYVIDPQHSDYKQHIENTDLLKKTIVLYDPYEKQSIPFGCYGSISKPIRLKAFVELFDSTQAEIFGETEEHKDAKKMKNYPQLNGCIVAVVDDNRINLAVAKGVLQTQGVTAITVDSGHELIDLLIHYQKEQIELGAIFMDCNMPVLDGYQTTKAIRNGNAGNYFKEIPIIAMTANAMSGERDKCVSAGMNDYVTKPIIPEQLFLILSKYIKNSTPLISIPSDSCSTEDSELQSEQMILNRNLALERIGNAQQLYTEICTMFIDESAEHVEALLTAINHREHEKVRKAAHKLKGQAGAIGAERFHQLLDNIEDLATAQNAEAYLALSDKVTIEFQSLLAEFS